MAGVLLGWYFPLTKVVLYLNSLSVVFSHLLLECQISFLQTPQSTGTAPGGDHKYPHYYYYSVNCWCSPPVLKCLSFYFLPNPRGFDALFSPASLIYHQWISCNVLMPPLLIVMYKMRCKSAILRRIFSTR